MQRIDMPGNILLHISISAARHIVNLIHARLAPLEELRAADLPLRVADGRQALHLVDRRSDVVSRDGDIGRRDVGDGAKAALHLERGGYDSLQIGGKVSL